jgi:MoaA/NifB/PqqE/SkfB family radical SAM enzyme
MRWLTVGEGRVEDLPEIFCAGSHIDDGCHRAATHYSNRKENAMDQSRRNVRTTANASLDFLWMELTNRCNLQCSHCYAESSPTTRDANPLSPQEQTTVLADSYQLGCKKVQFIGGEPTLNKNLIRLICTARDLGFELIEVYTNLVHLPNDLLRCFAENNICIATSVYSNSGSTHDLITKTPGSFKRTIANLKKILSLGLRVRVSIIEMADNADEVDAAEHFLRAEIGVQDVRIDRIRPFGRADGAAAGSMGDLCGSCAGGTLCVAPDGEVAPCIMSKKWSVGSIRSQPLVELVASNRLANIRGDIRNAVLQSSWIHSRFAQSTGLTNGAGGCAPDDVGCNPLNKCGPDLNKIAASANCAPDVACNPLNKCGPDLNKIAASAN